MTIEFSHVSKTLREKNRRTKVLEDTSAVFPQERISGVLGSASSGKSTIIGLATGKVMTDAGRVTRSTLISFPVAGAGVFNGVLTARENIAFLCRVFGFDPVPIVRFVRDFTEVGKAIDKPFKTLDRDQKTRLLFTASYAIPFEFYISDENVVGGRGPFRAQCEELARERMKSAGFLIVSSSPRLLSNFCSDFFVIEDHRIVSVDTIDQAKDTLSGQGLNEGDGGVDEVAEGENDVPLV